MRLECSQTLFGTRTGVSKHTQINYEKGESSPGADYLAKAAELGVDVLYVVTGERGPARRPIVDASARHQDLIAKYDAVDDAGKDFIDNAAQLVTALKTKASKKTSK